MNVPVLATSHLVLDSEDGGGGWVCRDLRSPPPHTHTLESKETKSSTLEFKENDQILKNPDPKNLNKSNNHLTSAKLENKKQDKNELASRAGPGWDVPIER